MFTSCFDDDRDDNLDLAQEEEQVDPVDTANLIAEESELFGYLESLTDELGIADEVVCIIFVYPFTAKEYDEDGLETRSVVVSNDNEFNDFLTQVKEEHYINLSFPIVAELEDGTTFEVNNKEDLQASIEECIGIIHEQIVTECNGIAKECVWVVTLLEDSLPDFYDQSVFEIPEIGIGSYFHRGILYENSWIFYFIEGKLHLNVFLEIPGEDDEEEEEDPNPVLTNWNFDWEVDFINATNIQIRRDDGLVYLLQKECEEENYCTEFIFTECETAGSNEEAEFLLNDYLSCIQIMAEPFQEDPDAEPVEYVYTFHFTDSDAAINENAIDPDVAIVNLGNPMSLWVRIEDTDPETDDFIVQEISLLVEECE
ncbi:hypothetical protein BST85_00290 [Aureitalea marina]|uniref:Uncharacterized protein n=1 Tax=Aureitalea marina TaxID=930804 RepID=A0A2S7KLJ6_9FLAO|nr:hypothetical protein BST85_00290 [Aureitalea marina]